MAVIKTKVLFISPTPGFGGAECYMITMAEHAEQYGIDPVVCFEGRATTKTFIQRCDAQGLPYTPCKMANEAGQAKKSSLLCLISKIFRSRRVMRHIKPDVIHLTLPNPVFGLHIMIAAAILRIPMVVVFQWVGEVVPLSKRKRTIYGWCRRHQQQWVAVSQRDAQMIQLAFGVEVEKVIQNAAMSNRVVEKKNYDMEKDKINIVTVGRIGRAKGHDLMVQAIPHIIKQYPMCRFIWLGGGENAGVTHLIEKYGVTDYIVHRGFQSSVAEELVDADFFLLPSRSEGQSFALSEAMAAGVPILCSDAGGSAEVIRHKKNGVLFYADDACSMLDAAMWGLEHYDLMTAMGQQAKCDFRTYTGEMMVRDTYAMMFSLVHKG
ncbi:MAG: glycosyltransferase family 1 protein [Bacteroidia bacterium]|nr:glycosyltransferase family 1 protein [Bacteroidia bacterium]